MSEFSQIKTKLFQQLRAPGVCVLFPASGGDSRLFVGRICLYRLLRLLALPLHVHSPRYVVRQQCGSLVGLLSYFLTKYISFHLGKYLVNFRIGAKPYDITISPVQSLSTSVIAIGEG